MRGNKYRLNVRFDLANEQEKRIADYLHTLDKGRHGTINAFMIRAAARELEAIEYPKQRDFSLEDIRRVVEEALKGAVSAAPSPSPEVRPQEDGQRTARIDAALALFDCCQND